MAEHDLDDSATKEGGRPTLTASYDVIGAPSTVPAIKAVGRMAYTYPRVDAPGYAACDYPPAVKEFKAFPDGDEQDKNAMMNIAHRVSDQALALQ